MAFVNDPFNSNYINPIIIIQKYLLMYIYIATTQIM